MPRGPQRRFHVALDDPQDLAVVEHAIDEQRRELVEDIDELARRGPGRLVSVEVERALRAARAAVEAATSEVIGAQLALRDDYWEARGADEWIEAREEAHETTEALDGLQKILEALHECGQRIDAMRMTSTEMDRLVKAARPAAGRAQPALSELMRTRGYFQASEPTEKVLEGRRAAAAQLEKVREAAGHALRLIAECGDLDDAGLAIPVPDDIGLPLG